jgi:hypothetical protein
MSKIPTKEELAGAKTDKEAAAAKEREDASVKRYKEAIIAAMNAGESSYSDPSGNVSTAVQTRLRAEFGSAWTLDFRNARTGCTISWS